MGGPQTILSTTHRSAVFPTNMANVATFQTSSEDEWRSWDEDGGAQRFDRYWSNSTANDFDGSAEPRFQYRGLMIDLGRNFFPTRQNGTVDFFDELITAMAILKLNVLHLHVTEDQGWRLEIEGLEELTEFGAHSPG